MKILLFLLFALVSAAHAAGKPEAGIKTTRAGAELVDAPVTGSRIQAEGGQLSFLAGGSIVAVEAITPMLLAMGKDVQYLGLVGSGAKLKLINNFLCGVQAASLAEGLAWLERSGLDREKSLNILKAGAPGSRCWARFLHA